MYRDLFTQNALNGLKRVQAVIDVHERLSTCASLKKRWCALKTLRDLFKVAYKPRPAVKNAHEWIKMRTSGKKRKRLGKKRPRVVCKRVREKKPAQL